MSQLWWWEPVLKLIASSLHPLVWFTDITTFCRNAHSLQETLKPRGSSALSLNVQMTLNLSIPLSLSFSPSPLLNLKGVLNFMSTLSLSTFVSKLQCSLFLAKKEKENFTRQSFYEPINTSYHSRINSI